MRESISVLESKSSTLPELEKTDIRLPLDELDEGVEDFGRAPRHSPLHPQYEQFEHTHDPPGVDANPGRLTTAAELLTSKEGLEP